MARRRVKLNWFDKIMLGFLLMLFCMAPIALVYSMIGNVNAEKYHEKFHSTVDSYIADGTKVTGSKAVSLITDEDTLYSDRYVPEEYQTKNPEEVRYLIRCVEGSTVVGHYSDMSAAIQHCMTLTVEDLATGKALATREFCGDEPPSRKSSEGAVHTYPNRAYMLEWVQNVLKGTGEDVAISQPTEDQEQEDALAAALEHLSDGFGQSPELLTNYLTLEGFSNQAAAYAVEHCNADWMEEAVKRAAFILENYTHVTNRNQMVLELEHWGFTHEQAVYAADLAEYK